MILPFLHLPVLSVQAPPHTFAVDHGHFLLDGKPFQILAGEMHYLRIPPELWRQRVRMAKAMGLNTISTYVFWNMHEPEKGHFDFRGGADVARFVRICQEEGMYVLLRPGPYACAEWEFGGYPYWLLKEPGLTVRSDNPAFLDASRRYLAELAKQTAPLQVTHGGPILMVQVENEYGSYGRDKTYMAKVRDMLRSVGYDVPLYVAEGGSQLARAWIPGTVPGVNGGSWPDVVKTVDRYMPGGPYIVPEFYPGWLDHWGEPKSITDGDVGGFEKLIQNGVSVSMYMFHGGTNFGFMNGANYGSHYQPDITSYDYDAPLDETGRPRAKYFAFRDAIARVTGQTLPPVPAVPPTMTLPKIALTQTGSLWGSLPKPVLSDRVRTMEDLGQAYGYVLYRTQLREGGPAHLDLRELRDYATVMLNGKVVATLDRRRNRRGVDLDVPAGGARLDLLVENSGRINYGGKLPDNLHGITEAATLDGKDLSGWQIYSLPMKDPRGFRLDGKGGDGPTFYRGAFSLDSTADAFLDMRGWRKGVVWVNGHNLGRYWWIGPQQTLYVPGVWLRKGENTVTIFDGEGGDHPSVEGAPQAILNDLRPEPAEPKRERASLGYAPSIPDSAVAVSAELAPGDAPQTFRFGARSGRYLALETESTFAGEDFAALSEIELLDQGRALNRSKWKIAYVDSEETAAEDDSADNLLDGDLDSIWHSVWSTNHSGQPHLVVVDLGQTVTADTVRLTPRQGDSPGKLKAFRVALGDRMTP